MSKQSWKGSTLLNPEPPVLVSCGGLETPNLITIGWTGTICTQPSMVSISVRPERFSHHLIQESGQFAINLPTEALVRAVDWCGVKSGREVDKFAACGLHAAPGSVLTDCPILEESPVNLECRVTQVLPLGSHDLFLAEVVACDVDESLLDENGKLCLDKAKLIVYSHGEYLALGKKLGTFGYSVRPDYKEHLSGSIGEMMEEINRIATPAVLDKLAESIHASRHVELFTSDFSGMAARSFQQSMVVMGKLVQIVSDAHYTLDYLKVLTPEDLLITVSATGNFATLMEPMVQKVAAYKVLVTVNHAIKMWKSYDQVIYLSEKDNSGARTVYSQYGMTYFFDILYSYYVNKYRETDLLQGPISELPLSDSQKMRVQRCAE